MSYFYAKRYGNRIFVRDKQGERIVTKYPFSLFFKSNKITSSPYKTIHGNPLVKVDYNSVSEINQATKTYKEADGNFVYGMNNVEYQYIFNEYYNKTPPNFDEIKICNIDIEIEKDSKLGYSKPSDAYNRINAITINFQEHFYVYGLENEYHGNEENVHYIKCGTENELLLNLIGWFETNKPHVITGWNTMVFDIPYIINRGNQLIGEEQVSKISPFGKFFPRTIKDQYGKKIPVYDIVGISHLDYLMLYKKFTYVTRENYKLDTIAHDELGERKLNYDEYKNLQHLANEDWEKFIRYNIKDTDIVNRLDKKLKLHELIIYIAYMTGINYEDVFSPVKTWDVFIYRTLAEKNIQIPAIIHKKKKIEYIGAYVAEIEPGRRNWIATFDLNSLYPHLQMQYNISPEKLVDEKYYTPEMKEFVDQLPNPEKAVDEFLKQKYDLSFLQPLGLCITPNGQFYKINEDGFLPKILEKQYSTRSTINKKIIELEQESESTGKDNSELISSMNTRQMAIKILINAEYGAMANTFFRWYDIRNAEAITSAGQLSIKWIARDLNDYLNKFLKTEGVEYCFYSDTDSVFLQLNQIVIRYMKNMDDATITEKLDKFATEKIHEVIDKSYERLAKYMNAHKQKMFMKREVIASSSVHTGKKRYVMNVLNKNGVFYKKPKLKMMGIEAVRSSTPEFCRDAVKEVVRMILQEKEENVQEYIKKFKEDFFSADIESIAFPRGVNDIEKWNDFGIPRKRTPIAVRGSIVYNNFLDKHKLIDYDKINSGDKIKFCYLKEPNVLMSNVISFPDYLPEEIRNLNIEVDTKLQYEKSFIKPITTLLDACGWEYEKKINLTDFFN